MFESWAETIRINLEQIERYVEQLKKPSLDRIKLDYVLKAIGLVLKSASHKSGRAYKFYFEHTCNGLKSLLADVKYWESDGLFPEYIFKCPNCKTVPLKDVYVCDAKLDGLLLYGTCLNCDIEYVSDGGKEWRKQQNE